MPHDHSVFYRLVKQVPWKAFDALVVRLGTDADERGFDSRSHLVAMLYAQLSGAVSLREVAAGQLSHAGRLYHLGAVPARRSTLSDANRDRDSGLFSELFTTLLGQMHPGARRGLREATYLIDATVLPLPAHRAPWAHFSAQACGAKMHVIYDAGAERPIYAAVTPARVNDITAAQAMPIEPGATYVFDLGYYDYAWWAALDAAQCRIVTRLKVNTPLHDVTERPLPADSSVLSDRVGWLPARQARNRKNPMAKPVREVRVLTETGKQLRILSNDLNATAAEIAALYQRRWAIELFFRWVKQTLRIRHFFGCSENAVRIQIATALIAFLLLRLAQASQTAIASPLAFARLVRANLMHRRPIEALTRPPPRKRPWQFPHHQMALL